MGKPRYGDVCELVPSIDFCHAGLEAAMKKISPRGTEDFCTVTLSANVNGLIKAIDLCRLYKLELALSTTYEEDEWSLEYIFIDSVSSQKSVCWSSGA